MEKPPQHEAIPKLRVEAGGVGPRASGSRSYHLDVGIFRPERDRRELGRQASGNPNRS